MSRSQSTIAKCLGGILLVVVIWIVVIPDRDRADDSPFMPVYGMDFGELEDVQVRFQVFQTQTEFQLSTNASRQLIKLLEEDAHIIRDPGYKANIEHEGKFFIGNHVFYYHSTFISEDLGMDKRIWDIPWDREAQKYAASRTERHSEDFYRVTLEYGLTSGVPEEFENELHDSKPRRPLR